MLDQHHVMIHPSGMVSLKGLDNGHRLRINSSKTEFFDEAVDVCSNSFAIAGYTYQQARTELRKFWDQDPIALIKKGPEDKEQEPKEQKYFMLTIMIPGCITQKN